MKNKMESRGMYFKNRKEAGKALALKLRKYKNTNSILLALPRGGVPVAAEISHVLNIPLEILAVRKIGVPVFSELAAGAICEDDKPYFSENLMLRLGFKSDDLRSVVAAETLAVKRQIQLFRNGKKLPPLAKKNVIIVDDGLATGATMLAAIHYLKKLNVAKIIVAVPVAAADSLKKIESKVDEAACVFASEGFGSVGQYYEDFSQVEDAEVISLLKIYRQKNSAQDYQLTPIQLSIENYLVPFRKIGDLNTLIDSIKNSRIVMLGESSHGTHEYYELRSTISKKLIEDHGYHFIAVEGDWPDAYRLHRYIHGKAGGNSIEVLLKNHRWPTWMWANDEVAKLAEWMCGRDVGFYGLDVYSLYESIEEINRYVKKIDPNLAKKILQNYACFDPFQKDEISYARSLFNFPKGCEDQVLKNLEYLLTLNLKNSDEELFNAQQNAHIISNAESYYRSMIKSDSNSWNIRDSHMINTLDRLLEKYGEAAKCIIWAHNTHIGDYRATDMLDAGYINIGGLAREKYGADNVSLVGFGSYHGKVLAGSAWGAKEEIMDLPPAIENSFEWHCHQVALKNKLSRFHLPLRSLQDSHLLNEKILHRAVGVVYDPTQEARGNYVPSEIAQRYDEFIFLDKTNALRSIHSYADSKEFPETWPYGQ